MDFGLLPPEVNSGLMYSGPGVGPMLSSAASWEALAAELESAAGGYSSEIVGLAGRWLGPSSMRMAAAGARHAAWLQASAGHAGETAARAYAAAAAYETAYAMTVPPPVIAANRVQLMTLIATNVLGQNTPAIAATEAQYAEMWVQDATAMYTYAADAETAGTLTSFDEPSQTTNPNGQVDQANAVARAASADAQSVTQQISNLGVGPGGNTTINSGGTLTIPAGQTMTIAAGDSLTVDSGGSLIVNGTLIVNGSVSVSGTLTVNGTLTVGTGGVVQVGSGGFLTNAGSFAVTGGSVNVFSGGSLINTGSIALNGVVGVPTHQGVLSVLPGGTLANNGAISLGQMSNFTVSGTATIGPGGTVTVGGPAQFTVSTGGTVTVSGGTVTVNQGGSFAVNGTATVGSGGMVNVNHGSVSIVGGTVFVDPGGTVAVNQAGGLGVPGAINVGTATTPGSLSVDGGSLVLGPTGSVHIGGQGAVAIGPGEVVTIGPGGSVTSGGYFGPLTVAPPPAPASAGPSGLSSLLASPGLSATSAIQPQLNIDALLDALP